MTGHQPVAGGPVIPDATIARLPGYVRALQGLADRGVARVSSTELAEAAGVQPALLRRDLSHFGSYGTRGVGYEVGRLLHEVGEHVGNGIQWPVVLVGVGNMGRALATHLQTHRDDFTLVALVDADDAVVGTVVGGVVVEHQRDLEAVVDRTGARIGVITTPPAVAQQVCDRLCARGVRRVLNFAPTTLVAPHGCTVRTVDLSQELHILAFHEARSLAVGPVEENEQ